MRRVGERRGRYRPLEQLDGKHVDGVATEQCSGLLHQFEGPHQQISVSGVHLDKDVDVRPRKRGATRNGAEQARTNS